LGNGQEIFVLEMGTPIKIADIARDLIRLSGKEPEKDIEIVFTGLREGEKLHEELISVDEGIVKTEHEKILVLEQKDCWNGKADQQLFRDWLLNRIDELKTFSEVCDVCAIKNKLKEIVPEYEAQDSECVL
jgi:FlaA1/EpsC-like NDP-sugar epimerase